MGKARNELVALPPTGTAGVFPFPSSITTDAQGRVTAVGGDFTVGGFTMSSGNINSTRDVGVAQTAVLSLNNSAAATAGAGNQKWSPAFQETGQQWNGAASVAVDWQVQLRPVTGRTMPADLVFSARYNAGAWSETWAFERDTIVAGSSVIRAPSTTYAGFFDSSNNGLKVTAATSVLRAGSSADILVVDGLGIHPNSDLSYTNGDSTHRWTETYSRHFRGGGTAPVGTLGTGANVGAGSANTVTGSDAAGTISVTTGAGVQTASAVVITVTFNTTYTTAPLGVTLTPGNAAAAALTAAQKPFVSSTTATTFVVSSNTTALASGATYLWIYSVIG
jgi:hypothetical protein